MKIAHEYSYFKLVKISPTGEKIGYYNSNLDPENSWSSKNVDDAQILTNNEIKGVLLVADLKEKRLNHGYSIEKIGVY